MRRLHPLACLIICTTLRKLFFSAALLCTFSRVGITVCARARACGCLCLCACVCLGRLWGNLLFTLSAGEPLYDLLLVVFCNIDVHYESLAEECLLVHYMESIDEGEPGSKCLSVIIW